MNPFTFIRLGLEPGFSLLPKRMNTPKAQAMVLAIALQESDLKHRRQVKGPARSYLQFERSGISGVLSHGASEEYARGVCQSLDISPTVDAVYTAIEYCDPLAVAFARLLLWTDAAALPDQHHDREAWDVYLRTWRPGKPHAARWGGCSGVAHDLVGERA
jgi:hypothetical protein